MTHHDRADELLVADSFRVRGQGDSARVRGWPLHTARFARAAAATLPTASEAAWLAARLPGFLARASSEISASGEGFPRLELRRRHDDGLDLELALRPLPELSTEIEMRTAPGVTLAEASRKGPNIGALGELNRRLGAEALLLDAHGAVLEGATTSVLWWEGDTLYRVASSDRVPSVTEQLLVEISGRLGNSIAEGAVSAEELRRHEAWAVNALHGIRPITAIDGSATPPVRGERLQRFREALDGTWAPVLGASGVRV